MIMYSWLGEVISSQIYLLLAFVIFAVIIAAVLTIIELRLKNKVLSIDKIPGKKYIARLNKIHKEQKNPVEKLKDLNKEAKTFFEETFKTNHKATYTELIEEFKKINKKNEISFCEKMLEINYADKTLTLGEIDSAIISLIKLINYNVSLQKRRIFEIQKKEAKKLVFTEKLVSEKPVKKGFFEKLKIKRNIKRKGKNKGKKKTIKKKAIKKRVKIQKKREKKKA